MKTKVAWEPTSAIVLRDAMRFTSEYPYRNLSAVKAIQTEFNALLKSVSMRLVADCKQILADEKVLDDSA